MLNVNQTYTKYARYFPMFTVSFYTRGNLLTGLEQPDLVGYVDIDFEILELYGHNHTPVSI